MMVVEVWGGGCVGGGGTIAIRWTGPTRNVSFSDVSSPTMSSEEREGVDVHNILEQQRVR